MVQKPVLIAALQFADREILAFAGELSEAERTTSGQVDHWAPRDMLAHLGNGAQELVDTVMAIRCGETPADGINNDECYHRYKDWSWEEILSMIRGANVSLMELVQSLSEDELNAPIEAANGRELWRVIAGTAFLHTIIHLAQSLIERGEYDRAIRLNEQTVELGRQLDDRPAWQGLLLYNTGCYMSLMGRKEPALENLEKGMRLNPTLAEFSKQDTDLVFLHGDADFVALLDRIAAEGQP